MDIERRYLFDLLLIGDFCVGKSSLLYRLLNDNFPEASNPTTLVTMYSTRSFEQEDGKVVKLKIRDTHGLERFGIEEFKSTFYRDAHGIIIVYDVTDRESFNNVKHWIQEIGRNAAEGVNKLLVGNKCDLQSKKAVSYDEGKDLADSLNIKFLETSAKNAHNVEEAFNTMGTEIKTRVVQQGTGGSLAAGKHVTIGSGQAINTGGGCCGN
eukprot:GEMP01080485.1.p1 GENE.GEMP01080485.1~~GEMP01080485.1.p1  ORF type:complete len:210 (+),score=42.27 GEMP01080485.1:75-704(+)